MARTADPIKALEKALQQLRQQDTAPTSSSSSSSGDTSVVLKETRKFGNNLLASYDSQKEVVQNFLNTLDEIESGNFTPKRRGGRKKGVGNKPKTEE